MGSSSTYSNFGTGMSRLSSTNTSSITIGGVFQPRRNPLLFIKGGLGRIKGNSTHYYVNLAGSNCELYTSTFNQIPSDSLFVQKERIKILSPLPSPRTLIRKYRLQFKPHFYKIHVIKISCRFLCLADKPM